MTGGTVNYEGPLDIRATNTGSQSTLAGEYVATSWQFDVYHTLFPMQYVVLPLIGQPTELRCR